MTESGWLTDGFERNRVRLRKVAYRMLGSLAEADDAVQETWLRASRADTDDIDSLDAWLTTIVVRTSLNMLRSRKRRREEIVGVHVPDPIISHPDKTTPEDEVLLADSVGLAMQVVLDTLAPAERVAFVLHDMFDLTFDEIGPMVGRSTAAARQLASRARRRVRDHAVPVPDPDRGRQRQVVDAFFAAARHGELEAIVALLDPEVRLRTDFGAARPDVAVEVRGANAVAGRAVLFHRPAALIRPALVNGAAGVVITVKDRPVSVLGFTVTAGRIARIDVLADPERLARLDLTVLV